MNIVIRTMPGYKENEDSSIGVIVSLSEIPCIPSGVDSDWEVMAAMLINRIKFLMEDSDPVMCTVTIELPPEYTILTLYIAQMVSKEGFMRIRMSNGYILNPAPMPIWFIGTTSCEWAYNRVYTEMGLRVFGELRNDYECAERLGDFLVKEYDHTGEGENPEIVVVDLHGKFEALSSMLAILLRARLPVDVYVRQEGGITKMPSVRI